MDIPTVEQMISNVAGKYLVSAGNTTRGINGFLFDINVQDEVVVENDITDHYIEKNSAIQDHVARRPKIITLRGYVGELKNDVQTSFGYNEAAQQLLDVAGLAPNFASQSAQAYAKVAGVVSLIDSYINSINTLSDLFDNASSSPTAQQRAMDKLTSFAEERILCTVQTPFGIFKNMVITRLMAVQREDTTIISDFIVTLKEIRLVDMAVALTATGSLGGAIQEFSSGYSIGGEGLERTLSGRAQDALSLPADKGQVVGKSVTVNIFDQNWNVLE